MANKVRKQYTPVMPVLSESQIQNYERLTKLSWRHPEWHHFIPVIRHKYTKADIIRYISAPRQFQDELRRAARFIYYASPHFHRLIQYFVGLSDLAYVVSPCNIDTDSASEADTLKNFRKVLKLLSNMKIQSQFKKILTVCLREDTFFGTFRIANDDITIQQLPTHYCKICTVEGGVPNVTFDFRYFDRRPFLLDNYTDEFREKYQMYRDAIAHKEDYYINGVWIYEPWWIELDSPNSFAVKCNNELLDCSIPPFAGVLPEVFDIEAYKELKMDKTEMENYAMLVERIPLNNDGTWAIDFDKARDFWRNLDQVLPQRVGSVLTPMPIDKISFESKDSTDKNTITEAEETLFTAAGVSSLLFNNAKASANALLLSIKADQSLTYGIVKSIEDVVNRFIQAKTYGRRFKVTFLDCSPYNRKELGDAYLKAASYGLPTISMYAASQGLGQAELDSMSFLEGRVLGLQDKFRPIQSSSQMSSEDLEKKSVGAQTKDNSELTDSGEQTREDGDDW